MAGMSSRDRAQYYDQQRMERTLPSGVVPSAPSLSRPGRLPSTSTSSSSLEHGISTNKESLVEGRIGNDKVATRAVVPTVDTTAWGLRALQAVASVFGFKEPEKLLSELILARCNNKIDSISQDDVCYREVIALIKSKIGDPSKPNSDHFTSLFSVLGNIGERQYLFKLDLLCKNFSSHYRISSSNYFLVTNYISPSHQ